MWPPLKPWLSHKLDARNQRAAGHHSLVLTPMSFRHTRAAALRASAVAALVAAVAVTAAAAPTDASARGRAFAVAPYVDMSLYPPPKLATISRQSGLRYFSLAFVLSGGGCKASWGGVTPVDQERAIVADLKSLRTRGGDALVSFGGANGVELAQACASAETLAAQYQAVITRYRLTRIDFDIEGGAVSDSASIVRRGQAIAILQRTARSAGRRLAVSFTLPVLPDGLTGGGVALVRSTIKAGAKLSLVNGMAMDYGDSAAPNPSGRMGYYAIKVANSLHRQLRPIFPALSAAKLWATIGVTPMIGVNDTPSELFAVSDARQLVGFARSKHLGLLAFWSLGRDRQCPGGAKPFAQPTCSSIAQSAFAFGRAFGRFGG